MSDGKRLSLLVRHIEHVQDSCKTIAQSLVEIGEFQNAKELLQNSMLHDSSKFTGIEWDHLTTKDDPLFFEALRTHVTTNRHHPEYWSNIHDMPRVYIQEMVADWYSRSIELDGLSLNQWIEAKAMDKYNFDKNDEVYDVIHESVGFLLEPAFA